MFDSEQMYTLLLFPNLKYTLQKRASGFVIQGITVLKTNL